MEPSRPYLRPPWMVTHVGNRMAVLFGRRFISQLTVPGRRSGKPRSTPVAVLEYGGEHYLIVPRGNTHWARNLRAAGRASSSTAGAAGGSRQPRCRWSAGRR
jgi:deazaflavin-dependent oxidoreductase (nitroreductase family)